MQFEKDPNEDFKYGLIFESADGEVEAVSAAYREIVKIKVREGRYHKIKKHEREFSMWANSPDRTILTNHPLAIALFLEDFYARTEKAAIIIAAKETEPDFDSDSIARRMQLGSKAFQLSGLIKLEYDHDTLDRMLVDQGVELFVESKSAPEHPLE